ncbi:hypothetical protein D9O36_02940 [Zobellia amurskyensis]|uniref:Uncharacterized protein n=1 Tax=Zobellia amurskyensis TaxID=248905 RepID=A0A7X3D0T5_9FLAO|nr:hypothetical protein [Zobellia amurskyensis]MUH34788.1 hypothetical protein [Zobellia amurskyensis]
MMDFKDSRAFTENRLVDRLDKLIEHHQDMKLKYPEDSDANNHFEWNIKELNLIRKMVVFNPRFMWKEVQKIMDAAYLEDKSITGFTWFFDFVETDLPNRAFIKTLISPK